LIGATFDDLEIHLKVISVGHLIVISTSILAIFGGLSRRAAPKR